MSHKGRIISHDYEIGRLQAQVKALQRAVGTMLSWMVGSANSPLRMDEARQILDMIEEKDK